MPPLRSLVRHFPQPSLSSTTPSIISIRTYPIASPQRPNSQSLARPISATAPFSTSASVRSGDAHGSRYDPPSGWFLGVPPGEKYQKEGWENIWVYGFWGSLGLAVVAYAYKPDTSIQTWALEEARRRLEAEGILPDPTSPSTPAAGK